MARPTETPRVATGQPYGQRQETEAGLSVAPLPRGEQQAGGAPRRSAPAPTGRPSTGGSLPSWLLERPSDRPDEPGSAGASFGEGPTPEPPEDDPLEAFLNWVVAGVDSQRALEWRESLRKEKMPAAPMPIMPPAPQQIAAEPAPNPEMEMDAFSDFEDEEAVEASAPVEEAPVQEELL